MRSRPQSCGGFLEFGTELVPAADGSLVALLGASPQSTRSTRVVAAAEQSKHNDLAGLDCQTGIRGSFERQWLFGTLSNHLVTPDKVSSDYTPLRSRARPRRTLPARCCRQGECGTPRTTRARGGAAIEGNTMTSAAGGYPMQPLAHGSAWLAGGIVNDVSRHCPNLVAIGANGLVAGQT